MALATLTTATATLITQTTAVSGGEVTADGGGTVTARGIVYGTTTSPTLANTVVTTGAGLGIFVSNLTGLTPGTTYYVRAYATNSAGTAYGNEILSLHLLLLCRLLPQQCYSCYSDIRNIGRNYFK